MAKPKTKKDQKKTGKKQVDLSIIILSYNTQFWLKKTLDSLKKYYLDKTQYQVKVIVVDNGSDDGSPEMIERDFKWAKLIRSGGNIGFAAGNNVALKKLESRYGMLLNSDTEFHPGSNLDILIEYLDEHDEVGVIAPRVEFPNGSLDPASHRGEPTPWASVTYFAGLEKLFPNSPLFAQYHQYYKNLSKIHEIDACTGAAMMFSMKLVKGKVGYLDEQFFMYAEDLDWCRRFREAGKKIIFHPGVQITHHKYKSGIKSSSVRLSKKIHNLFYDTMLMYYDKWYADKYPKFFRTLLKTFLFIKKGGL
jgi:GT2 family glycosyltransferase